ncbi:glucosaminidase domain-containing protein [Shewanella marinintestina]|uniref:glucosaminidase domain-containing protein n=1 Tax=Shewanella marinintestina TaxID=190305 RepID=UPI00200CBF97|nr:glucosaminidase domain-containing protein [Shewanella marinintestina]MCL1146858.1 glucosaminidase domain-containing protein [Shewanella marinintestina]
MSLAKIIASIIFLVSPMAFANISLAREQPQLQTHKLSLNAFENIDKALPLPPELLTKIYPDVAVIRLNKAKDLIAEFDNNHYQLSTVLQSQQLPSYFIENLPNDLNELTVANKISGFIRLMLPTIKAVNNQLLRVRAQVITLSAKPKSQWSAAETQWLQGLFDTYLVESKNIDELLLRLDIVPTGMVLAQAIDESGWGSSYFAKAGNNLFGEHLSQSGGDYLTTPGGDVKVAAFANLYQSTASYMHNLNTTLAYQELRILRRALAQKNQLTGYELVQALTHYSTRGQAYVDNLRALIKRHSLDSYAKANLLETGSKRYRFNEPIKR